MNVKWVGKETQSKYILPTDVSQDKSTTLSHHLWLWRNEEAPCSWLLNKNKDRSPPWRHGFPSSLVFYWMPSPMKLQASTSSSLPQSEEDSLQWEEHNRDLQRVSDSYVWHVQGIFAKALWNLPLPLLPTTPDTKSLPESTVSTCLLCLSHAIFSPLP